MRLCLGVTGRDVHQHADAAHAVMRENSGRHGDGAADKTDDGKIKCYGANSCKGTGACGGTGHACAGKNACKGQGFVKADSEAACLKMEGGRLTAEKK